MLYVFCDESGPKHGFLTTCAVAVSQSLYDERCEQISFQSSKSHLQIIDSFLQETGGLGVVWRVDLSDPKINPELIGNKGKQLRFESSKKGLALPDHVWAISMSLAIVQTLAFYVLSGHDMTKVDIYYDRKDLTDEHKQQLHRVLQEKVPGILEQMRKERTGKSNRLTIEIHEIPRAQQGQSATRFQRGVVIPDRLMRRYDEIERAESLSRIRCFVDTPRVLDEYQFSPGRI